MDHFEYWLPEVPVRRIIVKGRRACFTVQKDGINCCLKVTIFTRVCSTIICSSTESICHCAEIPRGRVACDQPLNQPEGNENRHIWMIEHVVEESIHLVFSLCNGGSSFGKERWWVPEFE